ATVRPVGQLAVGPRIVFESRHEEIEVVVARLEAGADDVAQRMTLRADHAARLRIEAGRFHDQALLHWSRLRRTRVGADVQAPRSVTALARRAEVGPARAVVLGRWVEPF